MLEGGAVETIQEDFTIYAGKPSTTSTHSLSETREGTVTL